MVNDPLMAQAYENEINQFDADIMQANADYAKARANGDPIAMGQASRAMQIAEQGRFEYMQWAHQRVAEMQAAPQPHPRGLSDDQMEHARICGISPDEYADGDIMCQQQRR